ncbi:MAG: multifunctional CCA tRNA nucleotidyl transferase/2'3'-cyclic phosphodiesterase/2'nucleotidase/phosphatase [Gammaproteobacteria bacterium]
MQIYLVGGAVRDQLLGLPVKERDWVVVGATPEEMLRQGFRPVGKDFPVFLHPKTQEEYALARTERKVSKGYTGFIVHATPDVTLEEDLRRRDLTINAIAQTLNGQFIDPYGGQRDLQQHVLRHVSPAFAEDPVRILRLARFAARFPEFQIHPETMQLIRQMVVAGEVNALVAERVWQELVRALAEAQPSRFFNVLAECQALPILFPELTDKEAAFIALQKASQLTNELPARFAALLYRCSETAIKQLCQRYKVPREYSDLALLVARYHENFEKLTIPPDPVALFNLIEKLDALRRPERLPLFISVCQANQQIATDHQAQFLKDTLNIARGITASKLDLSNLSPLQIGAVLRQARLEAVKNHFSH